MTILKPVGPEFSDSKLEKRIRAVVRSMFDSALVKDGLRQRETASTLRLWAKKLEDILSDQ